MTKGTTTFRAAAPVGDLASWMRDQRFEVSPPVAVTVTVLDTFDGRLDGGGLRLVATEERGDAESGGDRRGPLTVTLGGGGAIAVTVRCAALPTAADDLPAGPLRTRVAGLLGVRVLLPRLSVDGVRTFATRRDDAGKVVAAVTMLQPAGGAAVHLTVSPLAGYEQAASDTVELLARHVGTHPIDGDAIDVIADEQGVVLGSWAVEPGIPLDPDMAAIDGVRAVLANLRDAVVVNRDGAIAALDPEFLHDLRVAVRRTRAILRHVKAVLPRDVYEQAVDDFAWLGEITSPVRDLDVYQIEWPTYVDGLDGEAVERLDAVRSVLAARRDVARSRLASELGGPRADVALARWSSWLDGGDGGDGRDDGPKARRPLGRFIAKRIRHAHGRMIDEGRRIDASSPDEMLHDLRKDAKKLRYLVECFGGLYDAERRKPFVARLKKLQDNLGEHQDAAIHAEQLRGLAPDPSVHLPVATVLAAGQLVERMEQRRRATRDEFAERFEAFDSKDTRQALAALLATGKAATS